MRARKWVREFAVMMVGCSFVTAANAVDAAAAVAPVVVHAQAAGSGVNGHGPGLHAAALQPARTGAAPVLDALAPQTHGVPWRTGANASLAPLPQRRELDIHAAMNAAPPRSTADYFLLGLVGIALVAYQLLRKHRQLRPQTFSL